MLRQIRSKDKSPNSNVSKLKRLKDEGNGAWCERVMREIGVDGKKNSFILLLGGSDTMAFRLRVAQSHLREDMLPSFWSEVMLLAHQDANRLAQPEVIHVPLIQPEGPKFPPRNNGVIIRPLQDFDDPGRYPNIALVALPVAQSSVLAYIEKFRKSRSTLDALEHVVRWLAFVWGAGNTANPLFENYGLPSACMLETVFAAANLDITPGLESRVSCPEAIWTAARFWQSYFKEFKGGTELRGRYWAPHEYQIEEPQS
ncbi:MAG: hypothetical protein DYH15_06305 [Nitrosomonas sp. PRO4]|nr:hypothetical protein [Nitrosomonas sp. PRO4]